MRTPVILAFLAFTFLAPSAPATAAGGIVLRDPHFYDILQKNSRMRCLQMRDNRFGFLVERGDSDEIHVHVITDGKVEGEQSAWVGNILEDDHTGTKIGRYEREGKYGHRVIFVIGKRRSYENHYQLPGMLMQITELWSKDEKGEDKKDTYLDGTFRLACEAPLPR